MSFVAAADATNITVPLQPWEIDKNKVNLSNISSEALDTIQNIFVRVKGLYEGAYKGFYRNDEMEQQRELGECLGIESYEAINIIAEAIDGTLNHDDWGRDLMGLTAGVRIILDNERNCKFDKMAMDLTTYCFLNDCSWFAMLGHFSLQWAEAVYAFNMIWTTVVSSQFSDYSLSNDYHWYYIIGQNIAILLDDLVGFKPKDEYDYEIDEDEFAE